MQPPRPNQRLARAVAASFLTAVAVTTISGTGVTAIAGAGAAAAAAPQAGAAPCEAWTGGGQPPDLGGTGQSNALTGVAVLSPCDAWAVGNSKDTQTLIAHWDGASWTQVPSPDPGTGAYLGGVSIVSASDAWAVGDFTDGNKVQTLTVRWNGSAWKQVPSPNVSGASEAGLLAVRATSPTNAWAVGRFLDSNNVYQTLILHWNGSAWKQVPSPNQGGSAQDNELMSVGGISAKDAWAVGFYYNGSVNQPILLHWNGTSWKQVKSPDTGSQGSFLYGVRASSPSNAWAVGATSNGTADQTLVLHWNGSAWKRVKTPNPGGPAMTNDLESVVIISANDAWAVGQFGTTTGMRTLALHWDGSAWRQVTTPNLGDPAVDDSFQAVGASPDGSVWAVGQYYDGTTGQALAFHCC